MQVPKGRKKSVPEFEDFTWREAPPDKEGAKRNSFIKKAHSGGPLQICGVGHLQTFITLIHLHGLQNPPVNI